MKPAPQRSHLTVRNLPSDVARALEQERDRRSRSLNQTVIDLLRVALNLGEEKTPKNGLEALAGGWSPAELKEFEQNTAVFAQIDKELWS